MIIQLLGVLELAAAHPHWPMVCSAFAMVFGVVRLCQQAVEMAFSGQRSLPRVIGSSGWPAGLFGTGHEALGYDRQICQVRLCFPAMTDARQ